MTSEARSSQTPSWPFASPESGRGSTVYGISMLGALRFELWRVVGAVAGHAVFVRTAIHDRLGHEVAVAGGGRRRPLQRRRVPRVPVDQRAPLHAAEEVDDERNLGETEQPRGDADDDVPLQQARVVRVLHTAVIHPAEIGRAHV